MTEQEAIEEIKRSKCINVTAEAQAMAISALEEIQRYRTIGTVKECQELREKQREKKVEKIYKFFSAECPLCGHRIEAHTSKIFCPYCSQKLGWGD